MAKNAKETTRFKNGVAFIGFGEAAQAFCTGMQQGNPDLQFCAYDIKLDQGDPDSILKAFDQCGMKTAKSAAETCLRVPAVFSLVTAEQAEDAAGQAAQVDMAGCLYFDCNSCAPETKKRSAQVVNAAGGRYVDVAIMTPVHPKLHRSPCLLAGPHAKAGLAMLEHLGMEASIAGPSVGDASTRKMIRSIMVKGLEALTLECFLAARKAGIDTEIMASLDKSYPGFNWPERAPYMIERAITHGVRRAAEMREVAQTLRDLGLDPSVTNGTVARQSQAGSLALNASEIGATDIQALTDAMLLALKID